MSLTAGGSGTSTLTVETSAGGSAALVTPLGNGLRWLGGGGVLAGLLLFGIPARRRRWFPTLAALLLLAVGGAIECGGGGGQSPPPPHNPATTPGNYVFTVTGTDSANNSITVTSAVTLVVQ